MVMAVMKRMMLIRKFENIRFENLGYEANPSHALCALELEHTWLLFVDMSIMIVIMIMMWRRMVVMMMMMMMTMTWKKK